VNGFPHKDITERVIGAAIKAHRALGPGLLESAYEEYLADEMERRCIASARQVDLPVIFEGRRLDCSNRLDSVVEDNVILELKCCEKLMPIHSAQPLTYLRLAGKSAWPRINVNVTRLTEGVVRKVLSNRFPNCAVSASLR
jgi:GxxExxY protein